MKMITALLTSSFFISTNAMAQSVPPWVSYQSTGNPSDMVRSAGTPDSVATWMGKKVDVKDGSSTNQKITNPTITGGTASGSSIVGGKFDAITLSGQTLPFSSGGTSLGGLDSIGNINWAGWMSSAYVIVPDKFILSSDNGDDALAVQRAADFACSAGRTSAWIQFQSRTYNFSTTVSPKCAVHVSGLSNYQAIAWYNLPNAANTGDSGAKDLPPYVGTWISRQTPSAPAFSIVTQMARGTEIDHIGFYEPYQTLPASSDTSWTPTDGAYNILTNNLNGRVNIHDIQFRGVKYGIKLDGGVRDSIVEHIYGQCFNNCLYVSHNPDTIYVNDLQVKTAWSVAWQVMAYQQSHLDAIMLGRSDNPEFGNVFVYGARSAFHIFEDTATYTPPTGGAIGSGTTHKLKLNSLDADFTKWAILIDTSPTSAVTANIGILNHHGGDLSTSGATGAISKSRALEIQQLSYIQIGQMHDQMVDTNSIQFDPSGVMKACPWVQIGSLYEDMSSWNTPSGYITEAPTTACDTTGSNHPAVYVGMPIMRMGATSSSQNYTNGEVNLHSVTTTILQ